MIGRSPGPHRGPARFGGAEQFSRVETTVVETTVVETMVVETMVVETTPSRQHHRVTPNMS
jgi:hypothetical protein